jgi:hypothetical protein
LTDVLRRRRTEVDRGYTGLVASPRRTSQARGPVSWLPVRPTSGPSRRRHPVRSTGSLDVSGLAVFVPGHSSGGCAGLSPASRGTRARMSKTANPPLRPSWTLETTLLTPTRRRKQDRRPIAGGRTTS